MEPGNVLVRVGSHRARRALHRMLGTDDTQSYFSWDRPGEWREIPAGRLDEALKITGISKAGRKVDDLHKTWKDLGPGKP